MIKNNIIHWFRQDLRLSDNPALAAAAVSGNVLPVFILDEEGGRQKPLGSASRCWLHHSLLYLSDSLKNNLLVLMGNPLQVIPKLVKQYSIDAVYWNRCYEPWAIDHDNQLTSLLKNMGVMVEAHNGSLLWEPWEVSKKDGTHYKVFTPFYRKGCLQAIPPQKPIGAPKKISYVKRTNPKTIDQLGLLPDEDWHEGMLKHWEIGEKAAKKRLKQFVKQDIRDYQDSRNFPSKDSTSRLSPHLHWGEISPHQIWQHIKKLPNNQNTDCFLSELGWREFSYSLLYFYPDLNKNNLQKKFDKFPWRKNKKNLSAWQSGRTGYPFVDAGMRELWQTGFMHESCSYDHSILLGEEFVNSLE